MNAILNPIDLLVDVVALSEKLCAFPISGKLAYATDENFLGRVVEGYAADAPDVILLTKHVARALCQVQNELNENQLGLFVFDAYRPWRAVKDFNAWFHAPVSDDNERKRKAIHYPHMEKNDLAAHGYVAGSISKHNFGHTVDLVLINITDRSFLNMGACFDYFDEISHLTTTAEQIGKEAFTNRMILMQAMQAQQFLPYEKEFWHYEYHMQEINVPMDIEISLKLKGLNRHIFG